MYFVNFELYFFVHNAIAVRHCIFSRNLYHSSLNLYLYQVCQTLKKGNWTVERDEDMTGPFAYDDLKHWMAFDDATSLKIKTKYALIRNLGGVALYSIDADDIDNVCGNGAFSLLRSVYTTMVKLLLISNKNIL